MRQEIPADAARRLHRAIVELIALRETIDGPLPIAAAEKHMDDIEDHLNAIGAKLRAALAAIDCDEELAI
jgi:dihydrodipicolinate synthase/N-acetylneuraminate lyase